MKTSRFSEEQVIGILREAEGSTVKAVCARHSISEATFYKWRAKYGGMEVSEARQAGWTERELAKRPKGDATKVAIALRLREETTMTVAWIAQRLQMGSRDAVNNLLSRKRNPKHNIRDCKHIKRELAQGGFKRAGRLVWFVNGRTTQTTSRTGEPL